MARINKELVAMNLLTCPTSKEAAEKSGISVPTLYRLKKDTAFQSVLQKVKDNIFGETMHKAQGYCLESLANLKLQETVRRNRFYLWLYSIQSV